MKQNTMFGIHGGGELFTSYDQAEAFLIENYPERCLNKDATIEFCEEMIFEEVV